MYEFWPALYKHECHYPFLFSEETLRCENYTKVDCGSRYGAPWECIIIFSLYELNDFFFMHNREDDIFINPKATLLKPFIMNIYAYIHLKISPMFLNMLLYTKYVWLSKFYMYIQCKQANTFVGK